MNNLEQLPVDAQHAVYVISNPDGSDYEFLPLSPMAPDSELESLRARWAGRNLIGAGIAFLTHGIPSVILKEEPSDFIAIVRLTAAYARYVDMIANTRAEQQPQRAGDFVHFATGLWSLDDSRTDA